MSKCVKISLICGFLLLIQKMRRYQAACSTLMSRLNAWLANLSHFQCININILWSYHFTFLHPLVVSICYKWRRCVIKICNTNLIQHNHIGTMYCYCVVVVLALKFILHRYWISLIFFYWYTYIYLLRHPQTLSSIFVY